jgi:hypothetical protein
MLRGAVVEADGHRILVAVVALVLVTLAALVVGFTVAGVHKNAQIDELRARGVGVSITITGCQGLLGGSGSNLVGYSCRGSYVLGGHRYSALLPGMSGYTQGARVPSVAVPGDPALVSSVRGLDGEHASDGVFLLPAVLLGVLVALVALVALRWRLSRARPS